MNWFKKNLFMVLYSFFLMIFTIYILMDTFLISEVYDKVESYGVTTQNTKGDVCISDDSYKDNNIEITIVEYREYDTNIYVADIVLSDSIYLKTAFAKSSYGKNVVDKTSEIALDNEAILAINGDYYGVQENGYVLKNGIIYRDTTRNNQEDLVIYKDGSFDIELEDDINLEKLLEDGVYNVLSFGPALIKNGKVSVSINTEVDKAMESNPRTAIGIVDKLHYVFVVSDGRTKESTGLTLYELATFMMKFDVDILYNLDGGGSSTMYFNGKVINNPTTNGKKIKERSVSDIVFIGY